MKLIVDNLWTWVYGHLPTGLLDPPTSFFEKGAWFAPSFKKGFWDGRTRFLSFDKTYHMWRFPTGLLTGVVEHLDAREYRYELADVRTVPEASPNYVLHDRKRGSIRLDEGEYSYQGDALDVCLLNARGVVKLPTGAGKSEVGAGIINSVGGTWAWLTHKTSLMYQTQARLSERLNRHVGILGDQEEDLQDITVCMVQTLSSIFKRSGRENLRDWFRTCGGILLDECFPAGTDVDGRSIESLRVGDYVLSCDHDRLHRRRISNVFRTIPANLMSLRLADGNVLTCTFSHPIFVFGLGWLPAILVGAMYEEKTDVYLRSLRKSAFGETQELFERHASMFSRVYQDMARAKMDCPHDLSRMRKAGLFDRKASDYQLEKTLPESLLLRRVCEQFSKGAILRNDVCYESQVCLRQDEEEEPNAFSGMSLQGFSDIANYRSQAVGSRRQWEGSDSCGAATLRGVRGRLEHAFCCPDFSQESVSTVLQAGYRECGINGGYRSRWAESREFGQSGEGRSQGEVLERTRVVGFEIHEPTSDGTFGGMCPDGFVYNLEVEKDHNYFANGVSVHNCHHLKSDQWFNLAAETAAQWRIGLTATPPLPDSGGMYLSAMTGPILIDIPTRRLIEQGVLVPPRIWMIQVPVPDLGKKKLDYRDIYRQCIVENELRHQLTAEAVSLFAKEKKPSLTLVRQINHGKNVLAALEQRGIRAGWVTGKTTKDSRDRQFEDLWEGSLDTIVAQSETVGEGNDFPPLRVLINATGTAGGGSAKDDEAGRGIIQFVGRGLRRFPGKTHFDYVDFVDLGHLSLKKASLDRIHTLESEGYGPFIRYWSDYESDEFRRVV